MVMWLFSRIKVFPRSAYFKTKLNTDIGEKPKDVDVQECTPKVLSVVLRFIYGISLPKDLGVEDAKQLVLMADLYLMEDLKEAVCFGCIIHSDGGNCFVLGYFQLPVRIIC